MRSPSNRSPVGCKNSQLVLVLELIHYLYCFGRRSRSTASAIAHFSANPTVAHCLAEGHVGIHDVGRDGALIFEPGCLALAFAPYGRSTLPRSSACARAHASSDGRRLLGTTTAWRRSISFATTATMTVSSSTLSDRVDWQRHA